LTLGLPRVTQFAAERRYFLHTNDTENPMAAADIFNKIGENIAKKPQRASMQSSSSTSVATVVASG
jgi:hypothetical protein